MPVNCLDVRPANPGEAVALSYFTTIVTKRFDLMEEIWTDDAVQYIPYLPDNMGPVAKDAFVGKKEIIDHYRMVIPNRRDHVFIIDEIHNTTDPDCVIIEAHARSIVGETGGVYENKYVCIFKLRDGKIAELKEYTNPLPAMKTLAGAFDRK